MTQSAYHWTPANQRAFLEHLADHGSVRQASASVAMAEGSAHRLRRRKDGTAFAVGWDAALQFARAKLRSDLMDRALYGQKDVAVRRKDEESGDIRTVRKRKDNRLAMWMLGHMDARIAAQNDIEAAMSRLVAQDFDAFLDLIESEGDAFDTAQFIERQIAARPKLKNAHEYDLSQFCALFGIKVQGIEEAAEERYARDPHDIWQGFGGDDIWYTDYPPPPGFAGAEYGKYGDDGYRRELTERELAVVLADEEAWVAQNMPDRLSPSEARDAYFRFVPDPVDGDNAVTAAPLAEAPPMNRKMRRIAAALEAKNEKARGNGADERGKH